LVPTQGTPWPYPSSNWSGYSIDTAAHAVTDVKGSWTVPTVTVSGKGTDYASSWVGIDGDISNTVEQIGTDADQVNGKPVYYAWYEMYPAYPVYLDGQPGGPPNLAIHPGDKITAEVSYNGSAFVLSIQATYANGTTASYSTTQKLASAQQSSAEWIMEAQSPGSLTHFGSETFTGAQATINGKTGTIGAFLQGDSSTVVYQIDIATPNHKTNSYTYYATTGALNSTGDSFTVNYGPTQPPPPSGGSATHGPRERADDLSVVAQVAATPAEARSSSAGTEIASATPAASTVGGLASENLGASGRLAASGQPGGGPGAFSPPGSALSEPVRSAVIVASAADVQGPSRGTVALRAVIGATTLLTTAGVQGSSTAGRLRLEASAEADRAIWSQSEQPVLPPSTWDFFEEAPIEQMIGALALVSLVQRLDMSRENEERARPRPQPGRTERGA
jgi:Peptidase A4 family